MLDDTIRTKIEHFCAYQERCHEEVKSKLFELKCPYEDIDEYILYLIENDFLNEMRFAEQYSLGKFRLKKWGRNKIRYQLKSKKISEYCIKYALSKIDEHEYDMTLSNLFEKKLEELKGEKNLFILQKKIYQYLIQKGYESDLINTHTQMILFKRK